MNDNLKILIVAADKYGKFSPFVEEQINSLEARNCYIERYAHRAHGLFNYIKEIPHLRKAILKINPDVIHAHFGLTGLMSTLASIGLKVPVVITYHGCDINDKKIRPFSRIAMCLSQWNIFVSYRQMINAFVSEQTARKSDKWSIIPCGINVHSFDSKYTNHEWFNTRFSSDRIVLFAGSFESIVKNPSLAKKTIEIYNLHNPENPAELIELRGYSRDEVVTLMSKCNTLLLTSIREGSPQVIKEAMACGCPIVSVDVGDVSERIDGVMGCYIVKSYNPYELAKAIELSIEYGRTKGREKILQDGLDNMQIAEKLIEIYINLLKK